MSLTAGATLQNQKYAVYKQLHQSDFGVTYQAQHSILGRPVVLQTLNEVLRQRDDFAQLRQQFLNRVRAISQQPVGNLHVLDCFEEDGLPFVVFELSPGQALPQFSDWIPVPPAPPPAPTPRQATDPLLSHRPDSLTTQPVAAATAREVPSPVSQARLPVALAGSTVAGSVASPRFSMPNPPIVLGSTASRRAWMPMALIFISMLGGLIGVGLGFTWRFSSGDVTGKMQDHTRSDKSNSGKLDSISPRLAPHFFSREQSFPSAADWPISETPQLFTPDPMPIEAPYGSRANEYLPPTRLLPTQVNLSAPSPLPAQPSPDPTPESTIVSPPPVVASPLPSPTPSLSIPPAIGNELPFPVEHQPVEANPEPLPPVAPTPLPSPAPAELPPTRQPKVFRN